MEYIIGSSLLNLKNNRDIDYLELSNKEIEYKWLIENEKQKLVISQQQLFKRLHFIETLNPYQVFNYQYDKKIIGQGFPIEYNLLDYREKLIELIDYVFENNLLNTNKFVSLNGNCSKKIYHIAYNIFILENNSVELNQEQKEIIQKIHDIEMPVSYIDELKEKFYKIKNNGKEMVKKQSLIEVWNKMKNESKVEEVKE